MSFSLHSQHIDLSLGMHIVELRDPQGHQIIAQFAVGADTCPACGHMAPKSNLDELDPKAKIAELVETANNSHEGILEYARKHGLTVK